MHVYVLLLIWINVLPLINLKCNYTYKLMSRSSSCNACNSSDSSSSFDKEEKEELEWLWLSVSKLFGVLERTRLLQSCGWWRFRRDKTDWTFARTEWLHPTDWIWCKKVSVTEQPNTAISRFLFCLHYRSSNKRYVSEAQLIMRLCGGWRQRWRFL